MFPSFKGLEVEGKESYLRSNLDPSLPPQIQRGPIQFPHSFCWMCFVLRCISARSRLNGMHVDDPTQGSAFRHAEVETRARAKYRSYRQDCL